MVHTFLNICFRVKMLIMQFINLIIGLLLLGSNINHSSVFQNIQFAKLGICKMKKTHGRGILLS